MIAAARYQGWIFHWFTFSSTALNFWRLDFSGWLPSGNNRGVSWDLRKKRLRFLRQQPGSFPLHGVWPLRLPVPANLDLEDWESSWWHWVRWSLQPWCRKLSRGCLMLLLQLLLQLLLLHVMNLFINIFVSFPECNQAVDVPGLQWWLWVGLLHGVHSASRGLCAIKHHVLKVLFFLNKMSDSNILTTCTLCSFKQVINTYISI